MPRPTGTTTAVVWISSAVLVVGSTWKLLQWRARKRARRTLTKLEQVLNANAPLIDSNDTLLCETILTTAIKRAEKWMALSEGEAKPMVGQVGGMSVHKKPLLTLEPDYVLKPLITDHRGIREVAFYEAIKTVCQSSKSADKTYHAFLTGTIAEVASSLRSRNKPAAPQSSSTSNSIWNYNKLGEYFDTLAMALAILLHDSFVLESEAALRKARRGLKRETEILAKLAKFTPPYYGVMGGPANVVVVMSVLPWGGVVAEDAHLLLQDLTINFKRPCVMDLKMGDQSFEPDATPEKRTREFGKYPQQAQFGFRIVGMRFYDPTHADCDVKGFRCFQKPYGRSLTTMEEVKEAFRIYFSAGLVADNNNNVNGNMNGDSEAPGTNGESAGTTNGVKHPTKQPTAPVIRTRSISSLLVHLRPLIRWFEENKSLRFYASSLLIVYEGDVTADVDMASIKMIDFGRVRREAGGDPGYMHGLNTLKTIFTDLLEEERRT